MSLSSRTLEPELLDGMTANNPDAMRARRDLQRVNAVMGHPRIWKRILQEGVPAERRPVDIVDLGTGDASLLLRLASLLSDQWQRVRVHLVDFHPAVSDETLLSFEARGWKAEVVEADVMDWVQTMPKVNLIVTNLFLHHLDDVQLMKLFRHIAGKTEVFTACEPRRSSFALMGSRLLGVIGCGPVARYDAVVSVRAGFTGTELSTLWTDRDNWQLDERAAGLFSHVFIASSTRENNEVTRFVL